MKLMPVRFLRPGITTSKRFNRVAWEGQSLFLRLITLVDDYGRYEADPELLRSHAFPYGGPTGEPIPTALVSNWLQLLASASMVDLYEIEGKKYLQVSRWEERIRSRSKYPANPCQQLPANDSKCTPPTPSPYALRLTPTPEQLPANARKVEGIQHSEAQQWLNKLFERNRHWSYEEVHLLSEVLPIAQEDRDLLDWAYSLPRDEEGWAVDDAGARVMRPKDGLIQLLREFSSEIDKARVAKKRTAPMLEDEPDGWGGGYREAALAEFGQDVTLPPLFRNLPSEMQRRVRERRKKMGAGKNGS